MKLAHYLCGDDEISKIFVKELPDIDTLLEIIELKVDSYSSLFVYVPRLDNLWFNSDIIIKAAKESKTVYFTISIEEKSSFYGIQKRTYYESRENRVIHYYNMLLAKEAVHEFINRLFHQSKEFVIKTLVTIPPTMNGIKVVPDVPYFFFK